MDRVMRVVSQRAVVIFSVSSCCMCHSVKRLFRELGVSPAVYELDQEPRGEEMEKALVKMLGGGRSPPAPPLPLVFVGGKLVGPTDKVMSLHLRGSLLPLLKDAGAIWL